MQHTHLSGLLQEPICIAEAVKCIDSSCKVIAYSHDKDRACREHEKVIAYASQGAAESEVGCILTLFGADDTRHKLVVVNSACREGRLIA